MKKLVLEGQGVLKLIDAPTPVATIDQEVINVELAGLGGSEYLGMANPGIRNLPNAMAHGIIGQTSTKRRVAIYPLTGCGQCPECENSTPQLCNEWQMIGVHSDGGFSQQLALPTHSLIDIPDTLSWEQSAFIEPFANSVNAVELSDITSENSVAVIGAGGLGLGVIAACTAQGCSNIVTSDLSSTRIEAAQQLGGNELLNTNTKTFDAVFDTVGSVESRETAIKLTRKSGTCILLGFAEPRIELDGGSFIRNQKRIVGAFAYSKDQFKSAMTLAAKTKPEWVKNLSYDEVQPQLEQFQRGNFETIKAVLRPFLTY